MATLKDIATSLNLSVMAVSKALRDAPDIGQKTKERVRQEARRLGYIPNHLARSLRGGLSQVLGVILPALNDPYAANILRGLEEEASARSYNLMVASSQNNVALELSTLFRMFERQVEAVFVYPLVRIQQRSVLLDAAAQHEVPLVFLHHYPASAPQYPKAGWVTVDAQKGSELATQYLIERGHRRILYLSGPPASSSAAEHMRGFRRALDHAGIPYEEERVFLAGMDIEQGRQAMARALAEEVSFSAVVCASDPVAIGASDMLKKQGCRVPEDVSVVGFGDGLLAANYSTPLTTVRHPQVDLGKAAFNLWFHWLETKGTLGGRVLPVELIERASAKTLIAPEFAVRV